jgi:hypothetical protein
MLVTAVAKIVALIPLETMTTKIVIALWTTLATLWTTAKIVIALWTTLTAHIVAAWTLEIQCSLLAAWTLILGTQTVVCREMWIVRATLRCVCRAGTELSCSLAVSLAAWAGTLLNTLRRADSLTLITSKTR